MEAPRAVVKDASAGAAIMSTTTASPSMQARRETEVTRFAQRLGALSSKVNNDARLRSVELVQFFDKTAVSHQDVVLVLPSLDLKIDETEDGTDLNPLPDVGDSMQRHNNRVEEIMEERDTMTEDYDDDLSSSVRSHNSARQDAAHESDGPRPTMAASVLTGATEGAAHLEQKAAQNLGSQICWTRSTLPYAAHAVSSNMSDSFASLVSSRVKAWTLLLLRHSLSTGDAQSRTRLLSMLSAQVQVESAETVFKTLPLPAQAAQQPKETDVILPLLLEVNLQIRLHDKAEIVTLRAPGTISADFCDPGKFTGLRKVEIRLDTSVMLSSMVDQARIVVFKAVATATRAPLPPSSPTKTGPSAMSIEAAASPATAGKGLMGPPSTGPRLTHASSLASFRNALDLQPRSRPAAAAPDDDDDDDHEEQPPQLQKARASALRLNSVLHGKGSHASTAGMPYALGSRKIRGVKWDSPLPLPTLTSALAPSPKKQRMASATAAKLKSFKSFGRPHAGDFGSGPRNATFGEYGGRGMAAGLWGRDGKMAHHPIPLMNRDVAGDEMGMLAAPAERNATFDMTAAGFNNDAAAAAAAAAGERLLGATSSYTGGASAAAASGGLGTSRSILPRTATALENWLVKKSTSGGRM